MRYLVFDTEKECEAIEAEITEIFNANGFNDDRWAKPIRNSSLGKFACPLPELKERLDLLKEALKEKTEERQANLRSLMKTLDSDDLDWFPKWDFVKHEFKS